MTNEQEIFHNRISEELQDLERIVRRANKGWIQAHRTNDDLYVDSVALNLHSFYSGIERIFEQIANLIDGSIPTGSNWHQQLLTQMASEQMNIRPAIISEFVHSKLNEYRAFRHVARNVYTFNLDPKKIKLLVDSLEPTYEQLDQEVQAFLQVVKQQS